MCAFLSSLVDPRVVTSEPSLHHKSSINPPCKGLTLQLSPYVSETPNGIVYATMLFATLKLYFLQYTPLANFPLLGGQWFVFGRDGL